MTATATTPTPTDQIAPWSDLCALFRATVPTDHPAQVPTTTDQGATWSDLCADLCDQVPTDHPAQVPATVTTDQGARIPLCAECGDLADFLILQRYPFRPAPMCARCTSDYLAWFRAHGIAEPDVDFVTTTTPATA